jgi:hypothetical protein
MKKFLLVAVLMVATFPLYARNWVYNDYHEHNIDMTYTDSTPNNIVTSFVLSEWQSPTSGFEIEHFGKWDACLGHYYLLKENVNGDLVHAGVWYKLTYLTQRDMGKEVNWYSFNCHPFKYYAGDGEWVQSDLTQMVVSFKKVNGNYYILFGEYIATSVDEINYNSQVVYYDLMGNKVAQPQHGIYIKRCNGKTTKVRL